LLEYLKGNIVHIGEDYVIIENNGIGYRIMTSNNTISNINSEIDKMLFYVYLAIREDGVSLYGFNTIEEIETFKLLISVSKVGPKLACSILSSISTFRLKQAIVSNDVMQLCECPGVGKKTAERIILELKDKIDLSSIYNNFEKEENSANISKIEEVIEACTSLGYNKYEIKKVLDEIDIQNLEIEEIIKQILRKLSNRW